VAVGKTTSGGKDESLFVLTD